MMSLQVEALSLQRGERVLFSGLSFTVRAGEAVTLVGGNGVGKTSLIRAIAGLAPVRAGRISFERDGEPLDPDEVRRGDCHLIGHLDGLASGRTARQEVAFAVQWCGGDTAAAATSARRLGLEPILDLEVRKLSAGQRRRLALVRLIAAPRTLWLLDEPLSPLDARGRALIGEVMAAHLAGGGVMVAAIHDALPIPTRDVLVGG